MSDIAHATSQVRKFAKVLNAAIDADAKAERAARLVGNTMCHVWPYDWRFEGPDQ